MASLQFARKSQQGGAVMVVCLVFLLVLTMIGISSLTANTMQLSMAGNMRQVNISQQAAEVALRQAETQLPIQHSGGQFPSSYLPSFNGTNGRYALATLPSIGLSEQPAGWDVTDPSMWTVANSVEVAGILADNTVSQNPRYILEYLGRADKNTAVDYNRSDQPIYQYFFRITAIGWGLNGNISTILQSSFIATTSFSE